MNQHSMINEAPIGSPLRDWIQQVGLLSLVRDGRATLTREIANWVGAGCPSPAPNSVKMRVVRSHVERYRTPYFVETGTYMGSMTDFVAATGAECHSIEIDPMIYARAQRVLSRHRNVHLHLGDSGRVLPELLQNISKPTTFWLDGHYSGGFTGKAELDTPVSAELDCIMSHPVKGHVILIDDARDFQGTDGYPRLSSLLTHFDDHPDYRAEVSTDIIRITPRG